MLSRRDIYCGVGEIEGSLKPGARLAGVAVYTKLSVLLWKF